MDQTFQLFECFVKAGQVSQHLTLRRTAKRKLAREASQKGTSEKQPKRAGGAQSSQSQIRKPEDNKDTLMFEVRLRYFMSKASEYASKASQISTSINMASQ